MAFWKGKKKTEKSDTTRGAEGEVTTDEVGFAVEAEGEAEGEAGLPSKASGTTSEGGEAGRRPGGRKIKSAYGASKSIYYVGKDGTTHGPVTIDTLLEEWRNENIDGSTYVWDGVKIYSWQPIKTVDWLSDLLGPQ